MIRKTALLAGVAGAFIFAAPALAQDAAAPQTPDAAVEPAPAQPESLTLTPGATVKSADGTELGQLVGAQNGSAGQELTVRGADGQIRPVPVAGIRQDGSDIVVNATLSEYQAAAPIGDAAAPTPTPTDAAVAPPVDQPVPDEASADEPDSTEPN